MTALTPHFSLEEMTTTDVHDLPNTPPVMVEGRLRTTALQMETVRHLLLNSPIHVNSGYRSPEVNERVGGVVHSAHVEGYACDFTCPVFGSPLAICRALVTARLPFDQLLEEGSWVHISFDPRMRGEVLTKAPEGGYRIGLPS